MTKPGDSQTKKTIHELVKEFPEASYRELEIYKEKYEKEHRLRQAAEGETTIVKAIGMSSPEMKSLRSEVAALKQQLHTDRNEHQKNLDKIKKENNDLYKRIAKLTEAELAAHTLQKVRESGL